jgi:2-dehydropantoate 2-reductase
MKIGILGVGGVGGYFGARLAAAGEEVIFFARGRQLAALREAGLRIASPLGDLHLEKPAVRESGTEPEPCDVVLNCVKLTGLERTLAFLPELLRPDGFAVPLQNGVVSEDILAQALGPERVVGGVAQIAAVIEEPGLIRHSSRFARLVVGELDGSDSARVKAFVGACEKAGIDIKASTDISLDIWRKFALLAPLAGACCFYRAPIGEVLAKPDGAALVAELVAETIAVGRAKGIAFPEDAREKGLQAIQALPPDMKPSMLHDLEAGNALELPWLNGAIAPMAADLGLEAPANARVCAALEGLVAGRPGANS